MRHWWHPGTSTFAPSRHSDTCLWLAHALLDWLDETDDLAALGRPYRFLSRESEAAGSQGSLLEHALRGVRRALESRSARGLPLIGAGDWNDGLSHAGLDGRGESVWVGMFLFSILRRFAPILRDVGDPSTAREFELEAEALRTAVNAHGWDGEWYVAGTDDEGRPFGSSENKEGQLFLNPQTWAVITGIAPADRAERAMGSVRRQLLKPYGALLLAPAHREVDPYIGYITRYAPGIRENGGVYSHAATWAVQALAMTGDVDGALALYRGLLPPLRSADDPDRYAAEPYVMPGTADGPDSPYESRAGWTRYTGSAAWMRRVALHWLCGVRPSRAGLVVEPRLQSAWRGFSLSRPFRGDTVRVEVAGSGPYRRELDGEPIEAGPLRPTGDGRVRTLRLSGTEQ